MLMFVRYLIVYLSDTIQVLCIPLMILCDQQDDFNFTDDQIEA